MLTITIDSRHATPADLAFAARAAKLLRSAPAGVVIELFEVKPERPTVFVVDRIDFVPPDTRCLVCHRPLNSGSAYIVKDDQGAESPCGPSCLLKLVPDYRSHHIPDFTKASRVLPSETGRHHESHARPITAKCDQVEEEYLRLRYEKMQGFSIPDFDKLHEVYGRLCVGGCLGDDDRSFVQRLLERMPTAKFPGLSLENLQACYAYDHWLGIAIESLPETKREYLTKLRQDLRRRLFLTPVQVEAANKWLTKIPGVPELDPVPFKWAADRSAALSTERNPV